MACRKISLASSIHCCLYFLFLLPDQNLYIVKDMVCMYVCMYVYSICMYICKYVCVHIYAYLTVYKLYKNYCCHQTVLHVKHFYIIRSSAKCWVDRYYWGTGLAVTGWIRDIGQNVLQTSSETENSSSPSYFQLFSPISHSSRTPLLEI